jgi:hypothetical protein
MMQRYTYRGGWKYILGIMFFFLAISFFYATALLLLDNSERSFDIFSFGMGYLFSIILGCRFVLGATGVSNSNEHLGEDQSDNIKVDLIEQENNTKFIFN